MRKRRIDLSEREIKQVQELCTRTAREDPNNEISVNRAIGIRDQVTRYGCLIGDQATWVCRNMDYRGIKRPAALMDVVVPAPKSKLRKDPDAEIVGEPQSDIIFEMSRRVRRIEKMIKRML